MMTRAEIEIVGLQNARNTVVCNCRIRSIKKKGAPNNHWWRLEHNRLERSPTYWSTSYPWRELRGPTWIVPKEMERYFL